MCSEELSSNGIQVASFTGVVESRSTIELASTTTKEQQVSRPPATSRFEKEPARVMRPCGSFESVKYDKVRRVRRRIEAHKVDEVPIRSVPPLDTCGQ
jgi:hypothetical protein